MRVKAAQLGRHCDQLAHAGAGIGQAADRMTYHCPAGDRLRHVVTDHTLQLHRVIADVQALQRSILREAAELETTQQELDRVLRQLAAL